MEDQPNQSVARALRILEAFSVRPDRGIREIARELDIHPTTVHRIVLTLQNAGYLEQNPETRRYSLGPRVMKLANSYSQQNPLPLIARKVFEGFSDRFDYNFYLGTLTRRSEVVYLAVLDGRGPIKIVVEPGGTIPLHATAMGKLLLAFQDDAFIREFLAGTGLRPYTPRTITSPAVLESQIQEIRRRGFAVNDGELYEEVGAVAVPVYAQSGEVIATVCLAYPRQFADDRMLRLETLVALLNEISQEITLRSEGGLPDFPLQTETSSLVAPSSQD